MAPEISLACWILGFNDSNPFMVGVLPSKTVDHLKKAIKKENERTLSGIDAHELEIWKVSQPAPGPRHSLDCADLS